MNTKQIMKKTINVLKNNAFYQESKKDHIETAKTLTHWGTPETEEELVRMGKHNDGTEVVLLSNEGMIELELANYDMIPGLNEDFEKAGLFLEARDGGTWTVTEDI